MIPFFAFVCKGFFWKICNLYFENETIEEIASSAEEKKVNEKKRRCCGYTSSPSRSFFPQEKRRTPAGATTQAIGRPITQRVIARVKRAEKEPER